MVSEFGFVENQVDEYVCPHEIKGKYFIYMVLYVDDILLASMSLSLLNNTKVFLSKNFDTKDLGEACILCTWHWNQETQIKVSTWLISAKQYKQSTKD